MADELKFQVFVAPFSCPSKIGNNVGEVRGSVSQILGNLDLAFNGGNWGRSDDDVLMRGGNIIAVPIKKEKIMVFGEENENAQDVELFDNLTVKKVKPLLEGVAAVPAAEQELIFDGVLKVGDTVRLRDLIGVHGVSTILVQRRDTAVVEDNFTIAAPPPAPETIIEDRLNVKFEVYVAPFSFPSKTGKTVGEVRAAISQILGSVDIAIDDKWGRSDGEVLMRDQWRLQQL